MCCCDFWLFGRDILPFFWQFCHFSLKFVIYLKSTLTIYAFSSGKVIFSSTTWLCKIMFLLDPIGSNLPEAFQILSVSLYVRPSVHPYACLHLNLCFILQGQFTSDPNIFYQSWTPNKMTIRGLIRSAQDPPNPPRIWGAKIFWGGL